MGQRLPVLNEPVKEIAWLCPGSKLCPGCPLFKGNNGPCSGCTGKYHSRCRQAYCFSNCNTCGGGRRRIKVVAACGRSPLRDEWAKLFDIKVEPYAPAPVDIRSPLIPVILQQAAKYRLPEQFPQIDTWAVPVHKCMNLKGEFRSADLKDYLGLPKDRKLIFSTAGPDNFMEMLWEKGEELDYRGHGIDYWFPAHFSIYDNDSKFYQFFSAKRQQLHAVRVRSQFVWFRLGEHIPVEFLEPVRQAPSVLISTQQMYAPFNRQVLAREARIADRWFPKSASFFILGSKSLVRLKASRKTYEINERWLLRGLRGRDMQRNFVPELTIPELLCSNLKEVCHAL